MFCGKPVKGRSDKKYCDDMCRNSYNNKIKASENNPYIRSINNKLLKNRKILQSLLPAGDETIKITRQKLQQMDFGFNYYTHNYINKKGNTYFFCYDYGYLPLESDFFLLVKRKAENKI